jgi:serine/threonine protein kinase
MILLINKNDHTKAEIEEVNEEFNEMSKLESPNIADYLEKYEDRKKLYLVMEFIQGLTSI